MHNMSNVQNEIQTSLFTINMTICQEYLRLENLYELPRDFKNGNEFTVTQIHSSLCFSSSQLENITKQSPHI